MNKNKNIFDLVRDNTNLKLLNDKLISENANLKKIQVLSTNDEESDRFFGIQDQINDLKCRIERLARKSRTSHYKSFRRIKNWDKSIIAKYKI
jgi:hypothetical protein